MSKIQVQALLLPPLLAFSPLCHNPVHTHNCCARDPQSRANTQLANPGPAELLDRLCCKRCTPYELFSLLLSPIRGFLAPWSFQLLCTKVRIIHIENGHFGQFTTVSHSSALEVLQGYISY